MSGMELFVEHAGLCVVDIQEKLSGAMPEKVIKGTLRCCLNLIEAARVLGLPIALSEQYPEGLGRTLPVVAEAVMRLPRDRVFSFQKTQFSCTGVAAFDEWVGGTGRDQWIVVGMETHVCVFQTVRGLAAEGFAVHVPRDAVVSRSMANWEVGLDLISKSGAVVSSTETILFDLLKKAGTEEFRILSRLIR
jgi:nicotinamidase-related amidase